MNRRDKLQVTEDKSKRLVLTGDFNCHIDWENLEVSNTDNQWNSKLLETSQDFFLTQHILQNTRIRGIDQPSTLDLVFTREENALENLEYKPPFGKSDHVVLCWDFIVAYDIIDHQESKCQFNFKKGDYEGLKGYFEDINWEEQLQGNNISEQYSKFCEIYHKGVKMFIPLKNRGIGRNTHWLDGRCLAARQKRDLLWNRLRRHHGEQAYKRYKRARNEYTQVRREAEIEYQRDLVNKCKEEPKLFYSHVKSKTKVKDKIQCLTDQGKIHSKEEEICELLNSKFQSIFTQEFEEDQNTNLVTPVLDDIDLNISEIEKEMSSLDKSKASGPDEISCWVLKECATELSKPLHIVMQESLKQGKLPESWKRADIVPLFKKGNRQDPLNYRPVSLTSVVCKIMEKLIRKNWVEHLETNDMLSKRQFGFRKGRSCVSNLSSFYTRMSEILQKREGWVDSIYLDFKKAFDRVPHRRLLWKLQNYGGIQGKLLEWMRDFLKERKMRTVLRGKFSSWKEVISGVRAGVSVGTNYIFDLCK